jgi:hypothetical protein
VWGGCERRFGLVQSGAQNEVSSDKLLPVEISFVPYAETSLFWALTWLDLIHTITGECRVQRPLVGLGLKHLFSIVRLDEKDSACVDIAT